jgi:hypothetical protein
MQTLVTHTLYRPRTDNRGQQVFQLHPNAWRFAAGHVAKLELLGQSSPYGRASNGVFTVTVGRLELRPAGARVASGRVVQSPASAVLPPTAAEPTAVTSFPVTAARRRRRAGRRSRSPSTAARCAGSSTGVAVERRRRHRLRRSDRRNRLRALRL